MTSVWDIWLTEGEKYICRVYGSIASPPPPLLPSGSCCHPWQHEGGGAGAPALSGYDDLDGDRDYGCQRCPRRFSRSAPLCLMRLFCPLRWSIFHLCLRLSKAITRLTRLKKNEVWTWSVWIFFFFDLGILVWFDCNGDKGHDLLFWDTFSQLLMLELLNIFTQATQRNRTQTTVHCVLLACPYVSVVFINLSWAIKWTISYILSNFTQTTTLLLLWLFHLKCLCHCYSA